MVCSSVLSTRFRYRHTVFSTQELVTPSSVDWWHENVSDFVLFGTTVRVVGSDRFDLSNKNIKVIIVQVFREG